VIYYASFANFYNATGSLARFETKNILFCFEKRSGVVICKFRKKLLSQKVA
jgi:hypothetical protein